MMPSIYPTYDELMAERDALKRRLDDVEQRLKVTVDGYEEYETENGALKAERDELKETIAALGPFAERPLRKENAALKAHVERLREALEPFVKCADHTLVFLETRQKMHKEGVGLYEEEVAVAKEALAATPAQSLLEERNEQRN